MRADGGCGCGDTSVARGARAARREERHVVALVDETVRQQGDDALDAAVAHRRHRKPAGSDDRDAQRVGRHRVQRTLRPVLTILDGNRFLVCDDLGDVEGGVDGLYSDDTRHLSRWVMRVNGRRPEAALVGTPRSRLGRDLRPARRRHALAALAARHRARALRLGRVAAGAAGAREPWPGHRLGGRALRVRLRLPRSLRGQVAELRRARSRLREDDHAAPHLAPLRSCDRGVRVRRRRRRLRGRLPHRVLRDRRARRSRVRLRGDAARALRLVARRRRAAALARRRARPAGHGVPAARAHACPRVPAALRRRAADVRVERAPASRACTRSRSAT